MPGLLREPVQSCLRAALFILAVPAKRDIMFLLPVPHANPKDGREGGGTHGRFHRICHRRCRWRGRQLRL